MIALWVLCCFLSIWRFEKLSHEITHEMIESGWNSFYSLPSNCKVIQYAQINPLFYQESNYTINSLNNTIKFLTLAACFNSTDLKYQTR